MSGLIQRDFKSSHQRTISICLITTIPFNKFRKNHVPSHIHLYILDEAKMKEIWNFTYIEANLINSSKFDVTSNETFLRWSNRMPISIAIALDKVATPFASIETMNLSLSPPSLPSIYNRCMYFRRRGMSVRIWEERFSSRWLAEKIRIRAGVSGNTFQLDYNEPM